MHSKLREFLVALVLMLAYVIAYPRQVEIGGDQTAAVIAALSLVHDGTYKVPLHESYGPERSIEIGTDMRQTLKWYPPGYTLILYGLMKIGIGVAAAALATFYAAKFAWTLAWLAAGRVWKIPDGILIGAVAFSLFLAYPTTMTDIYESIAIALTFLALSRRLGEPGSAILMSVSTSVATLMRYAAIKLLGFYGVVELLRRRHPVTLLKVVLASIAPVGVYLVCTRVIAGDASPYHGVGPGAHTHWAYLLKGIYYAAMGGWSPTLLPLKALGLILLTLAVVGLSTIWQEGPLENWIFLIFGFQAYYLCSLIPVQITFGSMYDPLQPAFATPRFFSLAQPFSVAAMLFLAAFVLRRAHPVARALPAFILFVCAIGWFAQNRKILAGDAIGQDGFLRFGDEDSVHRQLRADRLDAVFDGTGVLMYLSVDPRIIFPDDIRSLHTAAAARIAVVRFHDQPNELIDDLEKSGAAPSQTTQTGRFEVDLFTLPAGYSLQVNSHRGFVAHI